MSERSYVWESTLVGDATIAPYSSAEWAELQRNLVNASRNDYGILAGTGNGTQLALEVQATGPASATVNLFAGAALVNGRLYINDATLNLSIGANASGNPRIDTVVIRRDTVAQTARAVVKQGTPAASPVPPTLQQDATTWEIPIAYITVANGFSVINQTDIANCGQVVGGNAQQYIDDVLNNSGGRLETGDVVIWDVTTARAVTTTTTENNPLIAGAWVGSTANGGRGRVQRQGFGWVKASIQGGRTASIGYGLVSSTSVKQGQVVTAFYQTAYGIGRMMESFSSADNSKLRLIFIDIKPHPALYVRVVEKPSGGSPGGINSGSFVTRWPVNDGTLASGVILPGITVNVGSTRFEIDAYIPYRVRFRVPGYRVNDFSARLFDVSNSASLIDGSIGTADATNNLMAWSEGEYQTPLTLTTQQNIRIEQRVTTTNGTDGKGKAPLAWQTVGGVPYAEAQIWRGWI